MGSSVEEVRTATTLNWSRKRLTDEDCKVMAYIFSAIGALPALVQLDLSVNQIGDIGLASFSEAVGSGALPVLKSLTISKNQIGDDGLKAFSEALVSGALAELKV